jgi:pimeloyl-ACP methyl ester carboxylesterase
MITVTETDLRLPGGLLHVYDTGGDDRLPVFWHHGTPNVGIPPEPLFDAAERLGIRWVSWDRPGYGGSTAAPERDVASAAGYAEAVAGALGIDRFVAMGHSGGAPHALACAALLPRRVRGVVAIASLAPYDADGIDWFAGMAASGVDALSAAAAGRAARQEWGAEHGDDYDPEFHPADLAALEAEWSWLIGVVRAGAANGPDPEIDDDVAYAAPWGFDPAQVEAPALLLHGELDRIAPPAHARWLAERCPRAELLLCAGDGHISVLDHANQALEWITRLN